MPTLNTQATAITCILVTVLLKCCKKLTKCHVGLTSTMHVRMVRQRRLWYTDFSSVNQEGSCNNMLYLSCARAKNTAQSPLRDVGQCLLLQSQLGDSSPRNLYIMISSAYNKIPTTHVRQWEYVPKHYVVHHTQLNII